MNSKLELHRTLGFYTQRYFFEDGKLIEEGARLCPYRSSRYFPVIDGQDVSDMKEGAKYHWGP